MRTFLIDANVRDRNALKNALQLFCSDLDIVGELDEIPAAVELIKSLKPEIIFIEIDMPNYSGFSLVECFKEREFEVVFVSAQSKYVSEAFEVGASGYLLKPIDSERLIKVVRKIKQSKLNKQKSNGGFEKLLSDKAFVEETPSFEKIVIPVQGGVEFLKIRDMLYLKADGSYTQIFMLDGTKHLIAKKLKTFEQLLEHPKMYKPHRSFVVNLDHVKRFIRTDGGYIIMQNDDVVSLSRDKRDDFLSQIDSLLQVVN